MSTKPRKGHLGTIVTTVGESVARSQKPVRESLTPGFETGRFSPYPVEHGEALERMRSLSPEVQGERFLAMRKEDPSLLPELFQHHALFFGHPFAKDHPATPVFAHRLAELGETFWEPGASAPRIFPWTVFPVMPLDKGMKPTLAYLQIMPVFTADLMQEPALAFASLQDRILKCADNRYGTGYHGVVGYGGGTKELSGNHGEGILKMNPGLEEKIATTHGDVGTSAMILEAVRELAHTKYGGKPLRVTVYGPNGVIGEAVTRSLVEASDFNFASIQLVGNSDTDGETKKYERLAVLRDEMRQHNRDVGLSLSQDKTRAALDHESDLIIVATTNMRLRPEELPKGAVVLDVTTPAACARGTDWGDRGIKVLHAGYVEFDERVLPEGFGYVGNKQMDDLGPGKFRGWGCMADTIVHAITGFTGHIVGRSITLSQMEAFTRNAKKIGMYPQSPESTVVREKYSWAQLREQLKNRK